MTKEEIDIIAAGPDQRLRVYCEHVRRLKHELNRQQEENIRLKARIERANG